MNVIENSSREEVLKFKLACKSIDELSDVEIWSLFLNFELQNENEIEEVTNILKQHRPQLYIKLNSVLNKQES